MRWTSDSVIDGLFPSAEPAPFGRRVKRARGARVPVIVVTGFLGAGKTTLVGRLLKTPEGANSAVVVNEFGEVGIDDALLRGSAEEIVLLGNGCVCCSMRSDLEVALRRLHVERLRGEVPSFERVIVETTGLADPGPILRTFVRDRALGEEFHVDAVIAVVDAANAEATLDTMAEARRQVAMADRIVVTKSDLVDQAMVDRVQARLRALSPTAEIRIAIDGEIEAGYLLEPGKIEADGFEAVEETDIHPERITSFVLRLNEPFTWPGFSRALETLTSLRGPDLLRVKGFVAVEGCVGPVVVHAVQHLIHPPVELDVWPGEARETRLVFVTRGLGHDDVAPLFQAVARLKPR